MNNEYGGIVATGIARSFGTVAAIRHIDFAAPPGEVTALIGPNGSGKTTLLLILASLLAPDTGTLTVGGVDPLRDAAAVRRTVGWMPDTLGVWESLTATEILTTMGSLYGMPSDRRRERAAELLAAVRLEEFADKPARVLSRGQQQRLSLARALIHDPAVLLLDEPASGLDPGSRVELRATLRSLADQGKTVVVSSHVLSELDEIADRAVFINRGESVKNQTLDEAGTQIRRYYIQADPMEPLAEALTSHGVTFEVRGDSRRAEYQVMMSSTDQAAWLLRTLVLADVAITAFAPAGGALEETYMSLDTDRQ
ncbi:MULTISPECIES: ABC transporter ATP-binding protein [unclassified Arthrobacter]|uniref:ABC transporter ATP-binding protein n=1 Tax=unclassified Arthrobacter TaxID=235627 RepID=UPI001491F041|nr:MULTISPECIES: ABC transporter ATP-binding protein [unclassified Arthrobacter]MBE0008234.1 ABC transporter ATP-binding protein [Arthrobacter sp. AET 35A]NOJ61973.1 ABC transporter ATP-binding protein [Arthrobacter sp. 147(2020)]